MIIEFEKDESSVSEEEPNKNLFLKHYKISEMTFYPYDGETVPTMPTTSGDQPLAAFSRPDLVTSGR